MLYFTVQRRAERCRQSVSASAGFSPRWGGCGLTCGWQLLQLNGLTANKIALIVTVLTAARKGARTGSGLCHWQSPKELDELKG